MKKEKLTFKTTSYSVSISGGRVESLRVKEDLKTVARVYDKGNIGVAGKIGAADDKELYKEAQSKLSQKIAYPCNLFAGGDRKVDARKKIIPPTDFVKTVKKLIERLNKTYPDFIFSNKINMTESEDFYENSEKTFYASALNRLDIGIVIQYKGSANIMDLGYFATQDYYDEDKIVEDIGKLLKVYNNKVDMPKEDLPVLIGEDILNGLLPHFVAEKYESGSSLFNGKKGKKIFNDKFSILSDRSAGKKIGVPFFDCEGTVSKDDKFYFVKNGVFAGLATNKRSADKYNLPLSGGAYSDFDEVPSASGIGVTVERTGELKDIVKGKAIYVDTTSGGDMTPDGIFGVPVQLAYLYDNGKLIGRLPEFTMNARATDLFGKDFIGAAKNSVFDYTDSTVIVGKFQINK